MKRNTKLIGDISELKVATALVEAGYRIFIPFGENHRADVIAEVTDGKFLRIQVKTGRLRRGVILFNPYSSHFHRKRTGLRSYEGEIDLFGVYCPDTGEVYLVPIGDVRLSGMLRIEQPKNRQVRKIRWAEAYRVSQFEGDVVGHQTRGGVSLPGLLPP